MRDYANMNELQDATLEVAWVLTELGETLFELLKKKQEEGVVVDVVVEKQVNALNESLISFFRQCVSSSHGIGSLGTIISLVCQIYNVVDHIVIVCPRIGDLGPKCGKCGFSHQTQNYGL